MRRTATAGMPVPVLVDALAAHHWGVLGDPPDAGLRTVLGALARLVHRDSGTCTITAAQIADLAGLTVRWVRHCLHRLESLGLVRWQRGGVRHGRPTPGFIRLSKRNLAQIVNDARARRDARLAARARATSERLATLPPTLWTRTRRQTPLSAHAELSAPLPPLQGDYRRPTGPAGPTTPPETTMTARYRSAIECVHRLDIAACALCHQKIRDDGRLDPRSLHAPASPEPVGPPRMSWRDRVRLLPPDPTPAHTQERLI